jgi:hypothetical protein
MIVEKNEDLIEEFRTTELSEKFPELTFVEVKSIVSGPWKFLKSLMENYELPSMRFMYLGVFTVYGNRVKFLLDNLEEKKKSNRIGIVDYNRIKGLLTNNLNKNEKKDK